ncbi:uncharacterized protein LOC121731208 [Aricia agestis]|uniref:uncharacterized protein LOC121731208 n=1 Tax=Aricia agestis TaxID=91739 RepID=UPI001C201DCC|nr:uncharacterized protein LOC121731208 [Aricia agestis]
MSKLEPLFDSYNEVQEQIETISTNVAEQQKERDLFEGIYFKTMALAKSKLGVVAEQQHNCSCDTDGTHKAHGATVKLPIIQLAKFDADVTKMYRQVEVNESQRPLQQILWRDEPSEPLRAYELNTVTYGTASAPFLAIRCLKQLADECTDPLIQEVISKDFYVDDVITGATK